jgi:hypothetical protein
MTAIVCNNCKEGSRFMAQTANKEAPTEPETWRQVIQSLIAPAIAHVLENHVLNANLSMELMTAEDPTFRQGQVVMGQIDTLQKNKNVTFLNGTLTIYPVAPKEVAEKAFVVAAA